MGGRQFAKHPPPKYEQLSVNQNCFSRLSPALTREGNVASSLGRGTGDRRGRGTQRSGRGCVYLPKSRGDIGENGWHQGRGGGRRTTGHLEAGEAMREGGSVLWWEAPGSGADTEGRLLLPPVRGVMRGNRAWRRREAAWAAGRGVWRSLDKEMMKRERYIYQGGGDGWEGG